MRVIRYEKTKVGAWLGHGRFDTVPTRSGSYKVGVVACEWGFVSVYWDDTHFAFRFIWNGNEYHLGAALEGEALTERKIVVRARKFARGIVGQALLGDRHE